MAGDPDSAVIRRLVAELEAGKELAASGKAAPAATTSTRTTAQGAARGSTAAVGTAAAAEAEGGDGQGVGGAAGGGVQGADGAAAPHVPARVVLGCEEFLQAVHLGQVRLRLRPSQFRGPNRIDMFDVLYVVQPDGEGGSSGVEGEGSPAGGAESMGDGGSGGVGEDRNKASVGAPASSKGTSAEAGSRGEVLVPLALLLRSMQIVYNIAPQ